jgi:peptidyl-prolyl cis-trans isomerase C
MAIAMARHILVKTEQEALNLKKRLAAGADFGQLAKKYSTCPSKRQGGSLGEVRPGQLVKPVDMVIFKKALHTVHGPNKTKFGYHLLETVFRD